MSQQSMNGLVSLLTILNVLTYARQTQIVKDGQDSSLGSGRDGVA